MHKAGMNDRLVASLRSFFDGMALMVDNTRVKTNIGVVQGGITSPLTFNLMIDNLIRRLNQRSICYALADDLVIYVKGDLQLRWVVTALEEEAAKIGIEISQEKSAIMEIQRGMRKPLRRSMIYGYPSVTSYKYLGVRISNNLNFKEDMDSRKSKV